MGSSQSRIRFAVWRELFASFDTDNNGKVSYKDIRDHIASLHPREHRLIEFVLRSAFKAGSTAATQITFDEFLEACDLYQRSHSKPHVPCVKSGCSTVDEFSLDTEDNFNEDLKADQTTPWMSPVSPGNLGSLQTIFDRIMQRINENNKMPTSVMSQYGLKSRASLDVLYRPDYMAKPDMFEAFIADTELGQILDALVSSGIGLSSFVSSSTFAKMLTDMDQQSGNAGVGVAPGLRLSSVAQNRDKLLTDLIVKEYDFTLTGFLNEHEFSHFVQAIQREIAAHGVFAGSDLKEVGNYITGRTLGFGSSGIVKLAMKRSSLYTTAGGHDGFHPNDHSCAKGLEQYAAGLRSIVHRTHESDHHVETPRSGKMQSAQPDSCAPTSVKKAGLKTSQKLNPNSRPRLDLPKLSSVIDPRMSMEDNIEQCYNFNTNTAIFNHRSRGNSLQNKLVAAEMKVKPIGHSSLLHTESLRDQSSVSYDDLRVKSKSIMLGDIDHVTADEIHHFIQSGATLHLEHVALKISPIKKQTEFSRLCTTLSAANQKSKKGRLRERKDAKDAQPSIQAKTSIDAGPAQTRSSCSWDVSRSRAGTNVRHTSSLSMSLDTARLIDSRTGNGDLTSSKGPDAKRRQVTMSPPQSGKLAALQTPLRSKLLTKKRAASFGNKYKGDVESSAGSAAELQEWYGAVPCGEVRALEVLGHHDYIVSMLDHFVYVDDREKSWDVLALTFCGGGSLWEYRSTTFLTESMARFFFYQIMMAVDYMHKHGVAHLDLRLENCLLDNNGDIKICDFGNSFVFGSYNDRCRASSVVTTPCSPVHSIVGNQEVSSPQGPLLATMPVTFEELSTEHPLSGYFALSNDMIQKGTIAGTLTHMPPEMLEANEDFSAIKADVWCCGLILYELLTAKPVFAQSKDSDLLSAENSKLVQRICNADIESLGYNYSAEARDLCNQLLNKYPNDRPDVGAILAHPWMQLPLYKPAIAKGLVMLDPCPSLVNLKTALNIVFLAEDILTKVIPGPAQADATTTKEDAQTLLRYKCKHKATETIFVLRADLIASQAESEVSIDPDFDSMFDVMTSNTGALAMENNVIRNIKLSDCALKITFFMKHGVLWEFQRLFRRIRFQLLTYFNKIHASPRLDELNKGSEESAVMISHIRTTTPTADLQMAESTANCEKQRPLPDNTTPDHGRIDDKNNLNHIITCHMKLVDDNPIAEPVSLESVKLPTIEGKRGT